MLFKLDLAGLQFNLSRLLGKRGPGLGVAATGPPLPGGMLRSAVNDEVAQFVGELWIDHECRAVPRCSTVGGKPNITILDPAALLASR